MISRLGEDLQDKQQTAIVSEELCTPTYVRSCEAADLQWQR